MFSKENVRIIAGWDSWLFALMYAHLCVQVQANIQLCWMIRFPGHGQWLAWVHASIRHEQSRFAGKHADLTYKQSVRQTGRQTDRHVDRCQKQKDQQDDRQTARQTSRLVRKRQIDLETDRGQGLAAGRDMRFEWTFRLDRLGECVRLRRCPQTYIKHNWPSRTHHIAQGPMLALLTGAGTLPSSPRGEEIQGRLLKFPWLHISARSKLVCFACNMVRCTDPH